MGISKKLIVLEDVDKRTGKTRARIKWNRVQLRTAVDKKEWKVLSRAGAYTRGIIRRSMRSGGKKRKKSDPGQPPRYHNRGAFTSLKDGILFQVIFQESVVLIGAIPISVSYVRHNKASGAQLLEEGGAGNISMPTRKGGKEWKRGRWRPRPYLDPSLEPGIAKVRDLMRNVPLKK